MYFQPAVKRAICLLLLVTFVSLATLWDAQPAQAGFLGGVFKAIGGAISGVVKGITGAIGSIASGIAGFAEKVGGFIKDTVLPLVAKAAPILAIVASVVAPYLAPAFAGIVSAIGTGAKIASTICSVIQSKGKDLLGAITGIAGSLGGPIAGIVSKVGTIAGSISQGIGMIKSGNIGGLLNLAGGALAGGKLSGVGSFLTGLGADTLANGNGISGLLGAVGGKIAGLPMVQNLVGGVTNILGGLQGKATGLLGNFQGLIGNVAGAMKAGAEGQASGILGSLGGILQKSGFVSNATGFIDGLAAKLTGVVDKSILAVKNFTPAGLVEKFLPQVAAKIKDKLGVSAFDARLGNLQGLLGNVQQFAAQATAGQGNLAAMFANAQAVMQRTGPDTVTTQILGQVDFEKLKLKMMAEAGKITDKKTRKLAEEAIKKLPPDMKIKQELRDALKGILR